jgi:fucose 4-O-acetylase-like acetyltransferase
VRRNEFLDFVKGVLITLVGIGHATQYALYKNVDFWQDPLFKTIYIFHMPLFMAVAGYLSFRGITNAPNLLKYVKDRWVSYLLPIITWAILFQAVMFFLKQHDKPADFPVAIFFEAVSSFWFLWALIGCISCAVIAQAAKKYQWLAFLTMFLFNLSLPDQWNIYLFQYTFPFFVGGFYIAKLELYPIQKRSFNLVSLIFLAIGSCVCFIFWGTDTYIYITKMSLSFENLPRIIFRWLSGSIMSAFVMVLLGYLSSVIPKFFKQLLILMGRDSIYIYILQSYVFMILLALSERYFQPASDVVVRDLMAIALGIFVVYGCWGIGHLLTRNAQTARILFGKVRRPVSTPRT